MYYIDLLIKMKNGSCLGGHHRFLYSRFIIEYLFDNRQNPKSFFVFPVVMFVHLRLTADPISAIIPEKKIFIWDCVNNSIFSPLRLGFSGNQQISFEWQVSSFFFVFLLWTNGEDLMHRQKYPKCKRWTHFLESM